MINGSAIAIDIETISPHIDNPNLQNPDHVELLCIGVGYREKANTPIETHVLFRRGTSPESELELLYRLYEWVRTHISDYLLTYNGTKFDFLHLRGRADRAERKAKLDLGTRKQIEIITELHIHRDLFLEACELYEEWPKLEEVCNRFGIEVPETRYKGKIVDNSVIPDIGMEYLESIQEGGQDMGSQQILIDYTISDIAPLFELGDRLTESRNR